ncbi:MAG TPA: endonuclease/exonuclease/phosphatase family protein [Chthoniobacterales bacterium]|nr:endonuclease/exonuclease/phosphatase family protein [Chthoniobacterales bacterium]
MFRRGGLCGWITIAAALLPFPHAVAEPIVVMSYNVENWLTTDRYIGSKHVPSAPKPESEKNAVADIIASHRPDILGVIEMGSREDLDDLRSRLKAKGLDYPNTEWHEGFDADRHVALLSRFPIVAHDSQDHIPFDLDGRPQEIQRGILDVTVEPEPGYQLRLIGLHLKSRRLTPEVDQEALRAKEAWFVRQYLDRIFAKDPATKLLLYGDLNTTKDDYPIKQILGPYRSPSRLTDVSLADMRGERWTHYYPAADDYSRIDYFMTSAALRRDVDLKASGIDSSANWNDGSDHRAIFTTIDPK